MAEVAELLGRDAELRQLDALVGHARNGRAGALLLSGEPGIGKTALLDAASHRATGLQVLSADGYEAESTMPYAALQRLMIPLREYLSVLPERQQRALRVAAGVTEGTAPDRFMVGLGALGLLAAASEDTSILCVIDDALHLDVESLDALAFVARRLQAESVALLLASRDTAYIEEHLTGVPRLRLGGLASEPAAALLMASSPEEIDPASAVRAALATRGNPLALIDLARELDARQLTGSAFAEEPFPIGPRLENFYLRRVRELGSETQLWVLAAAADSTGNLSLIESATGQLGVPGDAAHAAEAAGLVELDASVRFRHPLVKAAAYNAATGATRRRVHRALAVAAADLHLVELEAWHAAKATLGTDAQVADRLERVADMAGSRGGYASRASVLAQASALTPELPLKFSRLVAASEAALATGAAQVAKSMLDEVDEALLDPLARGRAVAVRASIALFTADPALRHSGADMLTAAEAMRHEPDLAQGALIQAFYLTLPAERAATGVSLAELGRRLEEGAGLRDGVAATILRGLSAHILLPYDQAVPVMQAAVGTIAELSDEDLLRYGVVSVVLTSALWDARSRQQCLERTAAAARNVGSLRLLDQVLWATSMAELRGGTPQRSAQCIEQIRELRRAIGYDPTSVQNAALLAWTGSSQEHVEQVAAAAAGSGVESVYAAGMHALAVRDIADGAYEKAFARLQPLIDTPFLHVTPLEYGDFVEAAVRSDRHATAHPVVERLEYLAAVNGSDWTLGVAARCRAMVQEDAEVAEECYRAALASLSSAGMEMELARTHLVYGEWLRRARRRREATEQLRTAAESFDRAEAPAFAERARRELRASGEDSGPPDAGRERGLTAQESTAARLAAAGHTNAEIGAVMFVSANTVDYHLRKVFKKFGISSRRQLADRLTG
ncbi:helix-turn-helix transcriptional regulator [Nocardioides sp. URHA0020]|uniref:helix-turn-helix transcriptional regulator n=1 Tax=Nocardioides sp. URHA0020 TaxID=1380392 RepID=UPI00048BA55A|nr:LuxR family transcriptional regulator [Nocardioides sp. URHA0020]